MIVATTLEDSRMLRMSRLHLSVLLLSVMASIALADSPAGAPVEKLILGFERAELAGTGDVSREEKPGARVGSICLSEPKASILQHGSSGRGLPIEHGHGGADRGSIPKVSWHWLPPSARPAPPAGM